MPDGGFLLNEEELSAYHEAGHIVLAAYYGLHCNGVTLSSPDYDGTIQMDYGRVPVLLVASIYSFGESPELFLASANGIDREWLLNFVKTLAMILAAGGAAELVLRNRNIRHNQAEHLELAGPDLIRLQSIDLLLRTLSGEHPENYIEGLVQRVYDLIDHYFWPAVDRLGQEILSQRTLSRDQIQSVLSEFPAMFS